MPISLLFDTSYMLKFGSKNWDVELTDETCFWVSETQIRVKLTRI